MSNNLDPDQDRHFVGPDLDPNCLQRLSADNKVAARKEKVITRNRRQFEVRHDKLSCLRHVGTCKDFVEHFAYLRHWRPDQVK